MSTDPVQHASHEPYCLAMVLCDAVHRDPSSGKFFLLGTFSAFRATSYPAGIRLSVFFALTDFLGRHTIRFRLVDASEHLVDDEQDPIIESSLEFEGDDPLATIEGLMAVQATIPSPGVYHCELYAGDSPLMTRRIVAIEPPQ